MTTLIHLVSEQTMQNLLPLLALRPERVVQLCSDDAKFRRIAANFENAARKAGIAAEFQVRPTNLLDGGWLELAIADMIRRGGRYADLHWSVEPPNQQGEDYGETDLIAVDLELLNLAVISCKTSTHHVSPLEHLSSWRDRARTLGGSHAVAHLCLFRANSQDQVASLEAIGRNMNVNIHIGDAIPAHFAP